MLRTNNYEPIIIVLQIFFQKKKIIIEIDGGAPSGKQKEKNNSAQWQMMWDNWTSAAYRCLHPH